jgi:hypothetical protein
MESETLIIVDILAACFEDMGIPYHVGGSVASSLFGIFRATNDVDIVIHLQEHQVNALVTALEKDFYIDGDMIRTALQYNISFNVIHLATMIKADLFPTPNTRFGQMQYSRRRREQIRIGESDKSIYFASPEDMVLQKLLWYRETGERSERQWGDVQGILKVQADALDMAYMRSWSEEIGVGDLFQQALEDAGL